MQEKVSIVTGASRGIGRAIALRLAREGWRIVASATDPVALGALDADIASTGGKSVSYAGDLRIAATPERLVQFALSKFGRIDLVVNCAGATKRGDFLALTEEDWADGFALKFFGAVRLTRSAWPELKANQGAVVFIAGSGGRTPGAQFTIGGSVNAAMLSLTKALADLGTEDGVRVNAINPGPVRTDRFRKRVPDAAAELDFVKNEKLIQIGEPGDVAALVSLLVGSEGRYFQGSLIDLDGGQTKTI